MIGVVIIRHGQTEWNRIERFRGRADIDLDDLGKKQAEATAERIAGWDISAIYSSSLRRTMSTAHILADRLQLTAQSLPGIVDIDFGKWQGLTPEEAAMRNGDLYEVWQKGPHLVTFPDGESLARTRARAAAAVDEIIAVSEGKTIAFVTHKVICQILILHFILLDNSHFWRIGQDVSAINLFQVRDGVPSAMLLNDTCHLKGLTVS